MPRVRRGASIDSRLVRKQGGWSEEIVVAGRQLIYVIQRLVAQGNVRRLLILKNDGTVLLETSLTTGATVAGAFAILAPMLTALAALAALLTEVRVKIVYTGGGQPPG